MDFNKSDYTKAFEPAFTEIPNNMISYYWRSSRAYDFPSNDECRSLKTLNHAHSGILNILNMI